MLDPEDLGILPLSIEGYQLTSSTASLRLINGGSRCPGPSGSEPPGYEFDGGSLTLAECAKEARSVTGALGFRWGSSDSLDWMAYKRLTVEPDTVPPKPVRLNELFHTPEKLVCFIYTMEAEKKNEKTPRIMSSLRRQKIMAKPMLHSGTEVCTQRWSVARFFTPRNEALWFCYLPTDKVESCKESFREWRFEGTEFVCSGVLLLAVLAWVMRGQSHFDVVMEWMARVALNLELAIFAMMHLVEGDAEGDHFGRVAFVVGSAVIGSNLLILPYQLFRRFEACSFLGVLYLLAIAYSPAVILDKLTYHESFEVLMANYPIALGFIGVIIETVRKWAFSTSCFGGSMVGDSGSQYGSKYTPMHSFDTNGRTARD